MKLLAENPSTQEWEILPLFEFWNCDQGTTNSELQETRKFGKFWVSTMAYMFV